MRKYLFSAIVPNDLYHLQLIEKEKAYKFCSSRLIASGKYCISSAAIFC